MTAWQLSLFGNIARADSSPDHSRALQSSGSHQLSPSRVAPPNWLYTVKLDVRPCNIGLHSVWQCAQDLGLCKWKSWRACHLTMVTMNGFDCPLLGFVAIIFCWWWRYCIYLTLLTEVFDSGSAAETKRWAEATQSAAARKDAGRWHQHWRGWCCVWQQRRWRCHSDSQQEDPL